MRMLGSGLKLTIWLITVGEPLPIVENENPRLLRTGRLALGLTGRGHNVVWWTSAFDHFSKKFHVHEDSTIKWAGGNLRLLKSVGYKSNISIRRLIEHAAVAQKFSKEARASAKPDVILVSLPTIELAHAAVKYGQENGVPVLVDIRDLWPDVLVDLFPLNFRWISRLFLSKMIRHASYAISRCSGLIAISEGYLNWGLNYARRPPRLLDVIIPLGYVAPNASKDMRDVEERMINIGVKPNAKICWYVGTFGRQYDLAPVICAARMLEKEGRNDIQFVISGDGEFGRRWRKEAFGLGNTIFTGWIGADEINWLRNNAAIGLQPYSEGAPQGLANKLFEYLSAGLPVVSSLVGENERLIRAYGCGLTYRAGDSEDCARQLLLLLDNDELRISMGAAGLELFENQFNAKKVFERLMNHIEEAAIIASPLSI